MKALKKNYVRRQYCNGWRGMISFGGLLRDHRFGHFYITRRAIFRFLFAFVPPPPQIPGLLFQISILSSHSLSHFYENSFPAGKGRWTLSGKQMLDAILVWKPP
jgi:hypothetical protein